MALRLVRNNKNTRDLAMRGALPLHAVFAMWRGTHTYLKASPKAGREASRPAGRQAGGPAGRQGGRQAGGQAESRQYAQRTQTSRFQGHTPTSYSLMATA